MKSSIEQLIPQRYFTITFFLLCWISIFLIYFPARHAMLIDDGMMGLNEIKTHGISGYWSSYQATCFYYGQYALLAMLYFLCGVNTTLWLLFFSMFHALNAVLIFKVSKKIYFLFIDETLSTYISLFGCLLFLLSPYQFENIVWAATPHYAVSLMILLIGLYFLIDYVQGIKTNINPFIYFIFFSISIATLEITFLFPLVFMALYVYLFLLQKTRVSFIHFFKTILLPQIILVLVYILLLHYFKGPWLPHDVTASEQLIPFPHLIISSAQHILKVFAQIHFLDNPLRMNIYTLCEHWQWTLLAELTLITSCAYFSYKREKENLYLFLLLLFISSVLYFPEVRLFFSTLFRYDHGRYEYFGTVFLFQLLAFLLFTINRMLRIFLMLLFLSVFSINIQIAFHDKREAGLLFNHFINSYPDTGKGMTYVLNAPGYCRETLVFWYDTRFPVAYNVIKNKPIQDRYKQIMSYVSMGTNDSFEVKKVDEYSYHFQLKTNGCWLMREGQGGSDYETDDYICDVDEWGAYLVTFKHLSETDHIFCYTKNGFVNVK